MRPVFSGFGALHNMSFSTTHLIISEFFGGAFISLRNYHALVVFRFFVGLPLWVNGPLALRI